VAVVTCFFEPLKLAILAGIRLLYKARQYGRFEREHISKIMQEELFSSLSHAKARISTFLPKVCKSRNGSNIVVFDGCDSIAYMPLDQFVEFVFRSKKGDFDNLIRSAKP